MFLGIEKKVPYYLAIKDNEGNALSYGQLTAETSGYYPDMKPRTVVFLLCRNTVGALVSYIGAIERACVPLMLSSKIDPELLQTLMDTYTPAYICVPEEDVEKYDFPCVYRTYGYCLLETGNQPYPLHEDLQLLMTTSGSTGSPKLVRYKRGNLEANAANVAKAFRWTYAERPVCDLGMQYTMGLNVINTHLYVGAAVLLTTYNLFSSDFWNYIRDEQATNFTGVPFSYDIFARLHFERMDLPYLTTLAQGGGKLTDARFRELANYAKENGKRFIASFGTTETSARMSMLPPELACEKTGSIGMAIPHGRLRLIDSEGKIITDRVAEGELCYHGPNVTMGYGLCREDLAKGDEWHGTYRTGDLARRDEDGCYYVTGRLSRFLKLLSYRVSLDQCERLVQEAFGIECACTGTDAKMEVYITDGERTGDVQSFLAAKTNLPKNLFGVQVIGQIPRNDSGKIRYKELGV